MGTEHLVFPELSEHEIKALIKTNISTIARLRMNLNTTYGKSHTPVVPESQMVPKWDEVFSLVEINKKLKELLIKK